MNFICRNCGECCKVFRMFPKNRKELIKHFEKHFGFKLKSYDNFEIIIRGECEHLKNNKCLKYEERPGKCKEFFCKRHSSLDVAGGQIYQKRCLVCGNIRKFMKGTERDRQSVCGNCWVW